MITTQVGRSGERTFDTARLEAIEVELSIMECLGAVSLYEYEP